ncbi:hypothetical protein BDY24DRAFT_402634 [Mrakia frigida]|uniref:uncharacterized protein n=1 Tax=Mrakia frigida TaxID=29902 RepID=UPI003FCBF899
MPSISILPLPSSSSLNPSSSSSTAPSRSFPVVGFLGLTPIILEGLILSRLSAPEKPLLASSVEVNIKCIESRLSGAFGVVTSEVLWSSSTVVWRAGESAPPREDGLVSRGVEEALGDWEGKFKVVIPVEEGKKAGRSSVSLREYRVVWRLEVVILHRSSVNPNDRFSKSIEIPLLLHSSAPSPTLPPSDPSFSINSYALSSSSTTLPSTVFPPLGAYGPGETIPIHLKGFLPSNRATIKKIVVSLRRRLEFLPATAATIAGEEVISSDWSSEVNTPADDLGGAATGGSSVGSGGEFYEMGTMDSSLSVASYSTTSPLLLSPTSTSTGRAKTRTSSRLTSFFSPRSSSSSLPTRRDPSPEPSSLSSRSASASSSSSSVGGSGSGGKKSRRASTPPASSEIITTKVLEVELDAIRAVGLKEWEADVELVLPRVKGSSRWTMGETGRTGMVTLGFELKVTVVVQPASSSASDPPQPSSSSSSSSFITPSALLLPFPHTFPVIVTSTSQSDRTSAALLAVPAPPSRPRTRSSSSRSKPSSGTRSSSSTATPSSPSLPHPSRPSMGTRSTSASSSSSSMYSLGNGSSFRGLEADVDQPRMSRPSGRSRRSDDSGGALSPLGPPSPRTSHRSSRTADALNRTREERRSLLSPLDGPSQSSLSSSNASTSTVKLQAYSSSPSSDLPTSFSTTSFESNDSSSTSRPSSHLSPPSSYYSSAFHRQIVSNLSTDTFDLGLPPLPVVSSPSSSSTATSTLLTPPPPPVLHRPIPSSSSKSSALGRFLSLSPPATTKEEDARRSMMATLIQGGRRISINPSEEEEDHPRRRVKVGVTGGEAGWGGGVVDFGPVGEERTRVGGSKRRPSTAPGGPVGMFGFGRG